MKWNVKNCFVKLILNYKTKFKIKTNTLIVDMFSFEHLFLTFKMFLLPAASHLKL